MSLLTPPHSFEPNEKTPVTEVTGVSMAFTSSTYPRGWGLFSGGDYTKSVASSVPVTPVALMMMSSPAVAPKVLATPVLVVATT